MRLSRGTAHATDAMQHHASRAGRCALELGCEVRLRVRHRLPQRMCKVLAHRQCNVLPSCRTICRQSTWNMVSSERCVDAQPLPETSVCSSKPLGAVRSPEFRGVGAERMAAKRERHRVAIYARTSSKSNEHSVRPSAHLGSQQLCERDLYAESLSDTHLQQCPVRACHPDKSPG